MLSFHITSAKTDAATGGMKRFMDEELYKTISVEANDLRNKVQDATPHYTGALRSSIKSTTRKTTSGVSGHVTSSSRYAVWVEAGSRPHWPPIAPLLLWAKRKTGNADWYWGLAKYVQKKIAKEGGRAFNMFKATFDSNQKRVGDEIDKAIDRALRRWARGF